MSIDAIQTFARELGARNVLGFEGDMQWLLSACDVWISASSTTILEATLAGKTSICVNFSGEPDGYPYVEDGAALPARSSVELSESLARALQERACADVDGKRSAFLRKHAGPTAEGRAAITLAHRLRTLL
jgi:hypothetical protein